MRAVDNALLTLIRATGVETFQTYVTVDNSGNTVEYPLPYATYMSSIGDDHVQRNSGHYGWRSVYFTVMYVGITPEQAKWAGEKIRLALYRKRVSGTGIGASGLIALEESQRVRRDDDILRPDGKPVFYGVDNFAVPVRLNKEGGLG